MTKEELTYTQWLKHSKMLSRAHAAMPTERAYFGYEHRLGAEHEKLAAPTQAQIEAAAIALFHQTDRTTTEWKILNQEGRLPWYLDAKAALTAAAEVGENELLATMDHMTANERKVDERVAAAEVGDKKHWVWLEDGLDPATIERCAQVADNWIGYTTWIDNRRRHPQAEG